MMRRVLVWLAPAAALSFAALPALAQVYPSDAGGDTYPSGGGVTTPYSTYTPAPSGYEPGGPMAFIAAPFAAVEGVVSTSPHTNCGVIRRFSGGYTAVCGP